MVDCEFGNPCIMKSIKENPIQVQVQARRKYDPTFKREAVLNWLDSGKSAEAVASELGVTSNLLYAWRKLVPPDAAGRRAASGGKPGSAAELQSRLDAALRENRHLREQRDILKKTLGILSEPSLNASSGSIR